LLYLVACLAPVWAVIAFVSDGFSVAVGPLRVKATEPVRPVIVGLIATVFYAWRYSAADIDNFWRALFRAIKAAAVRAMPVIALLGFVVGVYYGSFSVGGSDSYGYISQAELWLTGSLHIQQPWVQQFSWPYKEWTFAPLGYKPVSTDGTIVPTYASGLPLLMALFRLVLGGNGPFFVVPVLGALVLWLTFLIGEETTGSRATGALASLLLLTSPVFLVHLMVPMTDVAVAAGWTLVVWLALRRPSPRAFLAGLAAGATLLIRPNLLLLALVPVAAWRARPRLVLVFAAGVAPGVMTIAAINAFLYGSPLESGYGGLGDIYGWSSVLPNLERYGRWLIQTQTPFVVLALLPFGLVEAFKPDEKQRARLCLASVLVLTLVSYLFYQPFDQWTYLRFLLPAFPVMFVLMAAGIRTLCNRFPAPARAPVALLVCGFCLWSGYVFARDQFIFKSRDFERRYMQAAAHVAQVTPERAVVISVQHSGSVRYYAHRITLRYDSVYEHRLDTTLTELRDKGYRPYIVLDDWEENEFRTRFGKLNRAGRLNWKPLVRIETDPEVHIYDPEGHF
jgi:hypothetical protein